jgi:hypothetical protein
MNWISVGPTPSIIVCTQDDDSAFADVGTTDHVLAMNSSIREVLKFNRPTRVLKLFGDVTRALPVAFSTSDAWPKFHLRENITIRSFTVESRVRRLARVVQLPESN